MAATWKLEFPYRRSVGPVIGAFLTGLRDRRVVGVRTAGGHVLVPPFEYDPDTGECGRGDRRGRSRRGSWCTRRGSSSRCGRIPWIALRLGARATRRRRHAVVARARLRPRRSCATRHAGPHSLACGDHGAPVRHRMLRTRGLIVTEPVQFMSHHTAVEYAVPEPSLLSIHFAEQLASRRHRRPSLPAVREGLHAATRLLPAVRRGDNGGRRGRHCRSGHDHRRSR